MYEIRYDSNMGMALSMWVLAGLFVWSDIMARPLMPSAVKIFLVVFWLLCGISVAAFYFMGRNKE